MRYSGSIPIGIFMTAVTTWLVPSVAKAVELSPDSANMAGEMEISRLYAGLFSLPGVAQFRLPLSLNSVTGAYNRELGDASVDYTRGSGFGGFAIGAEAYDKYRNSTLRGAASYSNGKRRSLRLIENSDPETVYPYFTSDSTGGDIHEEIYSFSGGYDAVHGRLLWGISLSYKAGLHYRNVDPRPRNVTGLLTAAATAGLNAVGPYFATLTAEYRRYRQSNDISFFSEMGEAKLYHATGCGTHYARFAGNGKSSVYTGNGYGATLAVSPGYGSGFAGMFSWSRFSFTKILSDMNKLPMARAVENSLHAELGYMSRIPITEVIEGKKHRWGLKVSFDSSKRTGSENRFGTPSSGIYPLTGSEEQYHAYNYEISLCGLWQINRGLDRYISLRPEAAYYHRHQNYMNPVRIMTTNNVSASLCIEGGMLLPFGIHIEAGAHAGVSHPVSRQCYVGAERISDDEIFTKAEIERYEAISGNSREYRVYAAFSRPVSDRLAAEIRGGWSRETYSGGRRFDRLYIELSIFF